MIKAESEREKISTWFQLTNTATFSSHGKANCKQQRWARRWLACGWRRVLHAGHYWWNAIPDTFAHRDDDADDGNCVYAKWLLWLPYPSQRIPATIGENWMREGKKRKMEEIQGKAWMKRSRRGNFRTENKKLLNNNNGLMVMMR